MPLLVVHLCTLHLLQCVLPRQGCGRVVDPCNEPSLLGVFGLNDALSAEMLDEFGEARPLCSIHMRMVTIRDVFLIYLIRANASSTESPTKELNKLLLKGSTKVIDHLFGTSRGCYGVHLSKVSLRLEVAAISIFVSACLLADLTVKAQLGQPLGLDGVGDRLERPSFSLAHPAAAKRSKVAVSLGEVSRRKTLSGKVDIVCDSAKIKRPHIRN